MPHRLQPTPLFLREGKAGGPRRAHDPSWVHPRILPPVRSVIDSVHKEMGMTCQYVNVLVRVILSAPEFFIDLNAALLTVFRFIHTMAPGDAFRQGGVHSHDYGLNIRIRIVTVQHTFEPS